MPKKLWIAFIVFVTAAALAHADAAPTLPDPIIATLTQEYAGWVYAKHAPAVVSADFNGDGLRDYAVQIILKQEDEKEQIIIVFMKSGEGYEETVLQSQGFDPAIYLAASKKSVTEDLADGSTKTTKKDVLQVLGGAIGNTTYAQQSGEFHELKPDENTLTPKTDVDN